MAQNPDNYPYGPNPNYPGQPGQAGGSPYPPAPNTGYGGQPSTGPNSGYGQYAPPPPPTPAPGDATPNSGYGPYGSPYPSNLPPSGPGIGPYDATVASQHGSPAYPAYPTPTPSGPGNTTYPSYPTPSNPGLGAPPIVPPLPPTQKPKKSNTAIIITVVIALLIVVGGVLGIVLYNNHQTEVRNANGTATATTQNANATATANAQATATYIATHYPFSTNLVLNDPLSNTSNAGKYGWDTGTSCAFTNGVYQITESTANTTLYCVGKNTNFTNFTYEIQMSLKSGDNSAAGGVVFRAQPSGGKYYIFYLGPDGSYELGVRTSDNAGGGSTLKSGTISGFATGLFQLHTIGIVARGPEITIYVDQNQVIQRSDSSYSSGQIGVISYHATGTTPTVAAYTNAKVWQLS